MISIDDVVANKFFTAFKGFRTTSPGKVLSAGIWNPADSGVNVAVRQGFNYTQPYTAVNIKWRVKIPVGTVFSDRNSVYMVHPTSSLATSKAKIIINDTGPYNPTSDSDNYVLWAVDKDPCYDFRPEVPPVLAPGTGLVFYTDTAAAHDWTFSLVWEEQEIPAP